MTGHIIYSTTDISNSQLTKPFLHQGLKVLYVFRDFNTTTKAIHPPGRGSAVFSSDRLIL